MISELFGTIAMLMALLPAQPKIPDTVVATMEFGIESCTIIPVMETTATTGSGYYFYRTIK